MGQQIRREFNTPPTITTKGELDAAVNKLIDTTITAVKDHTPMSRPSPYAKRWFNPDLKTQQVEHNKCRRRWQTSCATRGKDHRATMDLFEEMRKKRRDWTRRIEKAKKEHWREFLDQAGSGSFLWKAAQYTKPTNNYASIPPLNEGDTEYTSNEDKARIFLENFFPQRNAETPQQTRRRLPKELPWKPITEQEIARALTGIKGSKAPGIDGLPTLVWKKTWSAISDIVGQIFEASIQLGYYPRRWKTASIVVMRKDGKPDYTTPDAYRPISLLNTLGKILERVMAKRLSYYAEKYRLLPDTQFGGRPGRSTEQALLILANSIDRALRKHKVLTLLAFDIKGAFNGVSKESIDARLRQKGIPSIARNWIRSFMEDRQANIAFDGFSTSVETISSAGLAQGSPLSPILFAFYNSDLVNQSVTLRGGASAFSDDYFRWIVSSSAKGNIEKLQEDDIPRIEEWARRNGAVFDAKKTKLIHFTRKKSEQLLGSITMNGETNLPLPAIKLLGVIFDQELRWKDHTQYAVKKATMKSLAIARLRFLRPKQMRELYSACVIPKMDYASTVWYNPNKCVWITRTLDTVQRVALIRAISAFRTIATETVEVENHMLPTRLRLTLRAQNTITKLRTMPETHPIHKVLERAVGRIPSVATGPKHALVEALRTMDKRQMEPVETIDPTPRTPWEESIFESIDDDLDPETAKQKANEVMSDPSLVIFSDGSSMNDKTGAAAVMIDDQNRTSRARQTGVGSSQDWSSYQAELIAIYSAINLAIDEQSQRSESEARTPCTYTVLSDCKSALQRLKNPAKTSY